MAYDNTNSGAIFKNKRREKETHPHYRGGLEVRCPHCYQNTEYWVSAWLKEAGPKAKNPGEQFVSLAIDPKDQDKVGNKTITHNSEPELEPDDIPF